jgi:hypothetical protein
MNLPVQAFDNTLLVAWRAWHARNEITHDKPLPSVEGSKRFLCSYAKTLRDIKELSTEQILKGKQPLLFPDSQARPIPIKEQAPDVPWVKPRRAGLS